MLKILVTGANGMIAKHFEKKYGKEFELYFYTRNPKKEREYYWNIDNKEIDFTPLLKADIILHLAGANIAEKFWTSQRKHEILKSRTTPLQMMYDVLRKNKHHIKKIISVSAIGFYGMQNSALLDENAAQGKGFLADVCNTWEQEAQRFLHLGVESNIVRLGLVISNEGGIFPKLKKALTYRINILFNKGEIQQNWIHVDDVVQIFNYIISNQTPFNIINAVSPNPISQKDFNALLASKLNVKCFTIKVPLFIINTIFGEMRELFVQNIKVSPNALNKMQYTFLYKNLEQAFDGVLTNKN